MCIHSSAICGRWTLSEFTPTCKGCPVALMLICRAWAEEAEGLWGIDSHTQPDHACSHLEWFIGVVIAVSAHSFLRRGL